MARVREDTEVAESRDGITRRKAVGYLIAAPFLVTGARFVNPPAASAAVPTAQPVDHYDLSTRCGTRRAPREPNMIAVKRRRHRLVRPDRAEDGQGITTAIAMIIAEEMDLPLREGRRSRSRTPIPSCCSTS